MTLQSLICNYLSLFSIYLKTHTHTHKKPLLYHPQKEEIEKGDLHMKSKQYINYSHVYIIDQDGKNEEVVEMSFAVQRRTL